MAYTATTIFGRRLEERLSPWMSEDLARFCDALGATFQPVLSLAEELGEDGQTPVTTQNYVPNPSFSHDVPGQAPAGWSTTATMIKTGATATVEATGGPEGGPCLAVTSSGANAEEGVASTLNIPVVAGVPLTLALYVRAVAPTNLYVGAGSVALGGTLLTTPVTTSWTRVEKTITFSGSGIAQIAAVVAAKEKATFYIAKATSPAQTYFDGDGGSGYYWAGTPGNSTSSHVTGYLPAWGRLLNPELCPAPDLPYLAQWVGVEIPKTASEAEQRELVKRKAGLERGTRKSIEEVIRKMLGKDPFTIQERTNAKGEAAPYAFNILVPIGKASKALEESVLEVKPAGLVMTILETKGLFIVGGRKFSEVGAGVKFSTVKEGEY